MGGAGWAAAGNAPCPRPCLADGRRDRCDRPYENDSVDLINAAYFFFFAFLVFFLATFFLAFFGMETTPLTFRSGRMIRVIPQNASNMSGLHFQMQYVRLSRESRASRKVHKTPVFIALD